jgi:hypothetical protein
MQQFVALIRSEQSTAWFQTPCPSLAGCKLRMVVRQLTVLGNYAHGTERGEARIPILTCLRLPTFLVDARITFDTYTQYALL